MMKQLILIVLTTCIIACVEQSGNSIESDSSPQVLEMLAPQDISNVIISVDYEGGGNCSLSLSGKDSVSFSRQITTCCVDVHDGSYTYEKLDAQTGVIHATYNQYYFYHKAPDDGQPIDVSISHILDFTEGLSGIYEETGREMDNRSGPFQIKEN